MHAAMSCLGMRESRSEERLCCWPHAGDREARVTMLHAGGSRYALLLLERGDDAAADTHVSTRPGGERAMPRAEQSSSEQPPLQACGGVVSPCIAPYPMHAGRVDIARSMSSQRAGVWRRKNRTAVSRPTTHLLAAVLSSSRQKRSSLFGHLRQRDGSLT